MTKKKIKVEIAWTESNEVYYIAKTEDDSTIIGTGYTKKAAIEDYEENLKNYKRIYLK